MLQSMNIYSCLLLAAALCVGGCQSAPSNPHPAAPGDVTVNFKDPEKFTDVRDSSGGGTSQHYLDVLSKHVQETAARLLTARQKLTVTFTDIDLAGDIPPGRTDGVRIFKSLYIPRVELNFQLRDASSAVILEGDRHLIDMNFQRTITPVGQYDALSYDKQLLTDWVRKEFRP